jgi:hypothetical protein
MILAHSLFTDSRHLPNDPQNRHSSFNLGLIITILTRFIEVSKHDDACWYSLKCQKYALRCRAYIYSTGILTCFPFPLDQLGLGLGPTYSSLTNIAKKPLGFRHHGFSPCIDPTITRILIPMRSINFYKKTSAHIRRLPTSLLAEDYGIGDLLSPVHFQGT